MGCPKCGGEMGRSKGTPVTATGKVARTGTGAIIGGVIGSVGGPAGMAVGAAIGATVGSRETKNATRYQKCRKCGHLVWEE